MSGIRRRIDDAILLWDKGRHEGAFLIVLIAVAATARKRYPKTKDREAFEQFLKDFHTVRLSVEYRGECHPIEHVFYKWLRCQLVHEAGILLDIQFMQDAQPGSMSVRTGGAPEYILKIGTGWIYHMIGSVVQAPENADQHLRLEGQQASPPDRP
jgi:hypothetical protein